MKVIKPARPGRKRSQQSERRDRSAQAEKPAENQTRRPQEKMQGEEAAPGELLAGEGAPGLTLTGGGGHA
jgi:hypothetical protein